MINQIENEFETRLNDLGTDIAELQKLELDLNRSRLPPRRKVYYRQKLDALRLQFETEALKTLEGTVGAQETVSCSSTVPDFPVDQVPSRTTTDSLQVCAEDLPENAHYVLRDKVDMSIEVMAPLQTARFVNLEKCSVHVPSCLTSVSIDQCRDCTFSLIARQIRVHDTTESVLRMSVRTPPILERCQGLQLMKYTGESPSSLVEDRGLSREWQGYLDPQVFDETEEGVYKIL